MKRDFVFTALITKTDDDWYYGQVEEMPEAMSQGKDVDELIENLADALETILEVKRKESEQQFKGSKYIRRKLVSA